MAVQVEFERLELKYLLDEVLAEKVRRAVVPYCAPDEHNGRQGRGYWISSLYFDSPKLSFFRANERSDPDRFKLRARIYQPGGNVHLEIKRKRGDVVRKDRVIVSDDGWVDATRGFGHPLHEGASQERKLTSFAQLLAQYGAEPRMVVEYEREAYVSPHAEYARVSFDRKVGYFPTRDYDFTRDRKKLRSLSMGEGARSAAVLLEFKCETLMPAWMVDVIHRHELHRVGISKYMQATRVELSAFQSRDPLLERLFDG